MDYEKFGRISAGDYLKQTHELLARPIHGLHQKTFEIALTMAGAVSAGAYTAGVLDFLVEALDEWDKVRGNAGVPQHQVKIAAMSGASAGSVVAAVLATCLHRRFEHGPVAGNPLYQIWVNGVDMRDLLGQTDFRAGDHIPSLFDAKVLDRVAASALTTWPARWCKEPPGIQRNWLGSVDGLPLKLIFAQTNLSGVPFWAGMNGGRHGMTLHADHIRFVLNPTTGYRLREDEYALSAADLGKPEIHTDWAHFIQHALGSSAFPLGLAHRDLRRRRQDYFFRYLPSNCPEEAIRLKPDWDAGPSSGRDYRYLCSDGGATNNEPFMFAHHELAGLNGNNPRDGQTACRAVIMIDPFPDPPNYKVPTGDEDVLHILLPLLNAMKDQCRFNANELMLADDENIYSRFLIAPTSSAGLRHGKPDKSRPLASGGLAGFSGFVDREYRNHDFMLGRYNCQRFLQKHLSVVPGNPYVEGQTTANNGEVPIIPLYGSALEHACAPAWPVNKVSEESFALLAKLMDARLKPLLKHLATRQNVIEYKCLLRWLLKCKRTDITDKAMGLIVNDLLDAGLLTRKPEWRPIVDPNLPVESP